MKVKNKKVAYGEDVCLLLVLNEIKNLKNKISKFLNLLISQFLNLLVISCLLGHLCTCASLFAQEEQEEIELREIIVTATKTEKELKDVPVETVVITKKDIENSNAVNVSQILRNVAGVYIRGENVPGESAWLSKMRGLSFDSGYVLILIDGERVKGGGMGEYGIGLNQLSLDMIERIEVVKGPASVLYGSDALAGVVNIITKPTPKTPVSVGAKLIYGSLNTQIVNLNYGEKLDKFSFSLSGNIEMSDRAKYGGRKDKYEAEYLLGKFNYDFDENETLGLKIIYDEQKWEYENNRKIRISSTFKTKLSDISDLTIKGYWYRWYLDLHSPGFTPRYGPTVYTQAEAQYNLLLAKKHRFTIGAESLQEDINLHVVESPPVAPVDKEITTNSIYLQNEMNFEPLTLILGGRIDNNSQYGTEINPKLSALFKIKDKTNLRASIGRAFKSPTIRQLYVFFYHHRPPWWNKPNPNLLPEKSIGYSFSIEHFFSEKLTSNFTFFRNDVRDMVVRVDTGERINNKRVKSWENIGKAYTQGIEVQLKSKPIKDLSLNLGYTYLDSKNIKINKRIPYNPLNIVNLTAIYHWRKMNLSFNIENKYVDEMYKDERNTQVIRSHLITNLKISKNINKHYKISLTIDNIFNSDYGEPEKKWPKATYRAEGILSLAL